MSIIVHFEQLSTAPRQLCYKFSLLGFLTRLPLRVVYGAESLASAVSDGGGRAVAGGDGGGAVVRPGL